MRWPLSAVFAIVLTPWIVRNFIVSGTPFGTAGYAMLEGTPVFPELSIGALAAS